MAADGIVSLTTIREIYKNGWLKKIPITEKRPGPFTKPLKPEKLWVVFCIHDEKDAFLEYYENRRSAYSHTPASSFSLSHCLHISPTIIIQDDDHEFAVTLGSQVIRLAAPTQELMNEWIDVLSNKLRELGVLQPKDNVYSKEPTSPISSSFQETDHFNPGISSDEHVFRVDALSTASAARDPNSPLPPIPPLQIWNESPSHTLSYVRNSPALPSTPTLIQSAPPDPQRYSSTSSASSNTVFTFDFVNSALYETAAPLRSDSQTRITGDYEPIFQPELRESNDSQNHNWQASVAQRPPNIRRRSESEIQNRNLNQVSTAHRLNTNAHQRPQSLNVLRDNRHYLTMTNQTSTTPEETTPLPARDEDPLPYELLPIPAHTNVVQQISTTVSLKQAQVQTLVKEIAHRGGVRLLLRKKDSIGAIALVQCFGSIWIAGWKQKEHPLLHNTFHIGDKIMTIAGRTVNSVQEAQKAIKQQPLIVEFVVQRLPHGLPLAIRREFEGQDLGIIREGKSAEIKEVLTDGLAARHGLPAKSSTIESGCLCNWVLTEVNSRPLNLFFRDNEVHERLNAVGRDISLLVQPSQLVCNIKKQLKSLRHYKDYIVQ